MAAMKKVLSPISLRIIMTAKGERISSAVTWSFKAESASD